MVPSPMAPSPMALVPEVPEPMALAFEITPMGQEPVVTSVPLTSDRPTSQVLETLGCPSVYLIYIYTSFIYLIYIPTYPHIRRR